MRSLSGPKMATKEAPPGRRILGIEGVHVQVVHDKLRQLPLLRGDDGHHVRHLPPPQLRTVPAQRRPAPQQQLWQHLVAQVLPRMPLEAARQPRRGQGPDRQLQGGAHFAATVRGRLAQVVQGRPSSSRPRWLRLRKFGRWQSFREPFQAFRMLFYAHCRRSQRGHGASRASCAKK